MRTTFTLTLAAMLVCVAATAGHADEAQELWTKNCASCHGADMKGQTKMGQVLKIKDFTAADVRAGFDRERMIKATKEGVKREGSDTPVMKPYAGKLTDEQIAALVDHIIANK